MDAARSGLVSNQHSLANLQARAGMPLEASDEDGVFAAAMAELDSVMRISVPGELPLISRYNPLMLLLCEMQRLQPEQTGSQKRDLLSQTSHIWTRKGARRSTQFWCRQCCEAQRTAGQPTARKAELTALSAVLVFSPCRLFSHLSFHPSAIVPARLRFGDSKPQMRME